MESIAVKELIEAGAHFGHRASRWNPRMKPYIFGKRNFIHIIDIRETVRGLVTAYYYLKEIVSKGGIVLFVGTKPQAQEVIKTEATRCGMPYVSERWLGGTLTNFETIRLRLNRLFELEKQIADGTVERYNKKEKAAFQREIKKLLNNLGGIREMARLPDVVVIVDGRISKNALHEARKTAITTVGLVDTDNDPAEVDIPIPMNDDSVKVIKLVISKLADAVIEGKANIKAIDIKPIDKAVRAAAPEPHPSHRPGRDRGAHPGRPRRPASTSHRPGRTAQPSVARPGGLVNPSRLASEPAEKPQVRPASRPETPQSLGKDSLSKGKDK